PGTQREYRRSDPYGPDPLAAASAGPGVPGRGGRRRRVRWCACTGSSPRSSGAEVRQRDEVRDAFAAGVKGPEGVLHRAVRFGEPIVLPPMLRLRCDQVTLDTAVGVRR